MDCYFNTPTISHPAASFQSMHNASWKMLCLHCAADNDIAVLGDLAASTGASVSMPMETDDAQYARMTSRIEALYRAYLTA